MKKQQTERRRARASTKPSLGVHPTGKDTIEKVPWYDILAGSGILAEAHMGTLQTRVSRARLTQGLELNKARALCGRTGETTVHLVLKCHTIVPEPLMAVLKVAIGLRGDGDEQERSQVEASTQVLVTGNGTTERG